MKANLFFREIDALGRDVEHRISINKEGSYIFGHWADVRWFNLYKETPPGSLAFKIKESPLGKIIGDDEF